MTAEERVLGIMHRQGRKSNKEIVRARMLDEKRCKVGDLVLNRQDYLMPENLLLKQGDLVLVYRLDEKQYALLAKVV